MADTLLSNAELKNLFQVGKTPTPDDFGHLIDATDAARQVLGLTTQAPVKDGVTPGPNSGLVYEKGHLKLALGAGLTLDRGGRLTFDSETEQAIRDDQSRKERVKIDSVAGYVAQAMYAAVQVSSELFTSKNQTVGNSKVDLSCGARVNTLKSVIEFDKPQYAFYWVSLHEHAWTWDKSTLGVLTSAKNPDLIKDNGQTVPFSTLKRSVNTGAFLFFGVDDNNHTHLSAEALVLAFNQGTLVAAGGWRLDSATTLRVDYAKWQNFLQP